MADGFARLLELLRRIEELHAECQSQRAVDDVAFFEQRASEIVRLVPEAQLLHVWLGSPRGPWPDGLSFALRRTHIVRDAQPPETMAAGVAAAAARFQLVKNVEAAVRRVVAISDLEVSASESGVTLFGTVDGDALRARALDAARAVDGVSTVIDRLRIRA